MTLSTYPLTVDTAREFQLAEPDELLCVKMTVLIFEPEGEYANDNTTVPQKTNVDRDVCLSSLSKLSLLWLQNNKIITELVITFFLETTALRF